MKNLMRIFLLTALPVLAASKARAEPRPEYLYRCEFHVSEDGGSLYKQIGHLVTLDQGSTQLILSTDYPSMLQVRITSWQMDGANRVRHMASMIVDPAEPMLPIDNGIAWASPGDTSLTAEVNTGAHYAKVECLKVNW